VREREFGTLVKPDFVLLHAPSVYDFRQVTLMQGPISDVVPSTPIFEMYPIGFMHLAEYLERNGYRTRIINLAAKMLKSLRFDAEKLIRKLDPVAFGIDFHWLAHAHGSLEVAGVVKRHHPETPVVMGGVSSTYFHRELIRDYPSVDYVVRGDSAEEPLLQLLRHLEGKKSLEGVPNLTWRENGGVRVNPLTHVPETLDDLMLSPEDFIKSVMRHRDLTGYLPFRDWMEYPLMAILTCRGCTYDCVTCGGSRAAYRKVCGRSKPAFRAPEKIAGDVVAIQQYLKGPVFLIGDIRLGGRRFADETLQAIRREGIDNPLVLELFGPATRGYLERVAKACSDFNLEISPESHEERVRRAQGKPFGNRELEKTIRWSLEAGCGRLDVFFMIGLPKQTARSVGETIRYCRRLLGRHGGGGRLHPFISPIVPFLDPGSLAFEEPEKYGYEVEFSDLEGVQAGLGEARVEIHAELPDTVDDERRTGGVYLRKRSSAQRLEAPARAHRRRGRTADSPTHRDGPSYPAPDRSNHVTRARERPGKALEGAEREYQTGGRGDALPREGTPMGCGGGRAQESGDSEISTQGINQSMFLKILISATSIQLSRMNRKSIHYVSVLTISPTVEVNLSISSSVL
jgi:B12-binding domain/radical SAM domain protein